MSDATVVTMVTDSLLNQFYAYFIISLVLCVVGALFTAIVDSKQNESFARPTPMPKLRRPILQH